MKLFAALHRLAAGLLMAAAASAEPSVPTDLRINYLTNARGLDDPVSVFTWSLPQSRSVSAQQLAARVVVVAAAGGEVAFDSGMVATAQPQLVSSPPLPPVALRSDAVFVWWVEVATPGAAVLRSDNASFSTGVLTQQEWASAGARWIRGGSGSTQMRKEFVVPAAGAPSAQRSLSPPASTTRCCSTAPWWATSASTRRGPSSTPIAATRPSTSTPRRWRRARTRWGCASARGALSRREVGVRGVSPRRSRAGRAWAWQLRSRRRPSSPQRAGWSARRASRRPSAQSRPCTLEPNLSARLAGA